MDKDLLIVFSLRLVSIIILVYLIQSFINASFSVLDWGALGRLAAVVLVATFMVLFHKFIDNG